MGKSIILLLIAAVAIFLITMSGRDPETEKPESTAAQTDAALEIEDAPSDRTIVEQQGGMQQITSVDDVFQAEPAPVPASEQEKSDYTGGRLPEEAFYFIFLEDDRRIPCDEAYAEAEAMMSENQLHEARRLFTKVYLCGERELRAGAKEQLDAINEKLIFDPDYKRQVRVHTVSSGETLSRHIAVKYGVSWRMLQRINNISRPERIRVGQQIKVPEGMPRIIVEKKNFKLTLFLGDYYVKQYQVGLGRDDKTPTGRFTIDSLLVEPDWYPPGGGIIKFGEEGHLIGTRWIGFEDTREASGYGIHGTNKRDSIGGMESDGCIRLVNEDVEELYDFLVSGTEVLILD